MAYFNYYYYFLFFFFYYMQQGSTEKCDRNVDENSMYLINDCLFVFDFKPFFDLYDCEKGL